MAIFSYVFEVFSEIYRVANRDFFGFGFGYMDFILACLLLIAIIKFSLNGMEGLSSGSISSLGLGIFKNKKMSNERREEQLIQETGILNGYYTKHGKRSKHSEVSYRPKHREGVYTAKHSKE